MKRDTHILKIVNNGKTFRKDVGVTCYPEQTYGISQQSPDHMKRPYSLTAKNGYLYRYDDNHPSNNTGKEEQLKNESQYAQIPFSQKKYCSIVGDCMAEPENFRQAYENAKQDGGSFRRKKGRLGQFMDKNGWMNQVIKIMGFERTAAARQASNKDRRRKIQSLPKHPKFQNSKALKPIPRQFMTSSLMYREKAKIRNERFTFRQKNNQTLEIQRPIATSNRDRYIEVEQMTNKMNRQSFDKNWGSTMDAIRKKSNEKPIDKFSLTCSDWKNNYKTIDIKPSKDLAAQTDPQELKQWFNSTCNSSTNPWRYRKPKKMDTNSEQEYVQNDN